MRPAAALLLLAAAAPLCAHGFFEKPFWNKGKENATLRGAAGAKPAVLWMMQPGRYTTGKHLAVGYRITAQDQDASTSEPVTLAFVPYAADGVTPDPAKGVVRSTFRLFGMGDKGIKAYAFLLTIGFPKPVPDRFGLEIGLPAAPSWPKDGVSVHAQLNLPNDSRRPRVPQAFRNRVFAFERSTATGRPVPLGGRTLDVLQVNAVVFEPALQVFLESPAYGLGTEVLKGPETLYPVAARGDKVGFELQSGRIGVQGLGFLFASPSLAKTPIPGPVGAFYLKVGAPWPVLFQVLKLDQIGNGKTATFPAGLFPSLPGGLWFQALVVNPLTREYEFSDAVGFHRL